MFPSSFTLVVLILLKICCVWCDDSDFTKIAEISENVHPFKLNGEIYLLTWDFIFPLERSYQKCRVPHLDVGLRTISILGNNKLLVLGETVTHFDVIDLTNCSSPKVTFISNGERDPHGRVDSSDLLKSVVTYNDSFDVFDHYQKTCMPCRYNDKGETLLVQYSLEKELTGQDTRSAYQHDGFSLELIKDAFGVKNGYFYVFKYTNETAALRILDSKFKVVKQRLLNVKIEAHSLLQENITVCYKRDPCKPDPANVCYGFRESSFLCQHLLQQRYRACQYVNCQLLDSNLDTIAEVKLHQIHQNSWDENNIVEMSVKNLAGGGAMVAMNFKKNWSHYTHHKDVFIQRIHPNGRVDPAIKFDSLDNSFLTMYGFALDNGEYCLITVNSYEGNNWEDKTLVKCLKPSPPDYEKL